MKKFMISLLGLVAAIGSIKAQDMDPLTFRREKIATIASNTATGNLEALKGELTLALDGGMTINEINEVLVQMYAYCGFPRSLQGITTFMNLIEERKGRGIEDPQGEEPVTVTAGDKYRMGKETLEQLTGRHEDRPAGANAFAPGIDTFLKEHLFADIFGRGLLSYADREVATVACLSSLTGVDPMLRSHLGMAMNTGITEKQLVELIAVIRPFAGNERAVNALAILSAVTGGGENGGGGEPPVISAFPIGEENSAYAAYFSGRSWLAPLTDMGELNVPVSNVTFEPGCRNNWHKHTGGQILIAVGGVGYYQERGKPAVRMEPGDVIEIAPDIEHWHGAAPSSWFSHLAIACNPQVNENIWLEPVSDEEYASVE